ncbi:MAG: Fe-S oxidoreductase [Syntrophaceae bacterium CG2_30_49_12]|nr:MAG: Fe-S oxidoreductase [Syntrophaceae bacterium CG2_30_49_12]PIP06395.1 MAG: Fe-S oxidoreductase [Syntrophobacterales bacterium CG23_combo_of_CG06-09_8_20_14_all_48_27]PJC77018.1 MAG: Fe-S oxidoreductase [Syntrophobacterales bacterium CG_4_8_14_3_um_filter_49_14]
MAHLTTKQKEWLEKEFNQRVSFDKTERLLYSHDIAAIPRIIRPFGGSTLPDAIIQPESEEEVARLVAWANENRIPLTPRGKASSGYGGAVPTKKGVVVDFWRMRKVIHTDSGAMEVTVQPGITWEKLQAELAKGGVDLRLYPTSAPSSTVGGWLAQGGAGIGSYAYGYFRDNAVSARVVLPDGAIKKFSGDDLDLIADAEGTTGFITEVTLRIRKREKIAVTALAFPDARRLQEAVEAMDRSELPLWSIVFINPRMAELKNRAPLMEHRTQPGEERVILPAAYVVTIAYAEKDSQRVRDGLTEIVRMFEGEVLSERIAEHEWKNRFKLMVVKRLGPSLVPAEVIVPLHSLGDVMSEIEQKVDQPVVKEGVIIHRGRGGKPEAVILGFIPSDQRRFAYNLVFGLVLTIIKIAERHGGRVYSTGMYFTKKAGYVLGSERVKKLERFKKERDRYGILNPQKVLGGGIIGHLMKVVGIFEPLIRPFGNVVITLVGERHRKPARGIPPDVAWYAYSCSQCGYCVDECDQFYGRGWESQIPRGKWYWLREYMEGNVKWDQKMVDTIIACTTCELCNLRCSASLPIESSWMKLRGQLIQEEGRMTFPPFEMMAAALVKEGNIWAGYRNNRDAWFPKELREKHPPGTQAGNVYFAGCTASYVEEDIGKASVTLLDAAGVDFTYLGQKENCCGTPMLVSGKWDIFLNNMKRNIASVKACGADTVITSCPACDMMWRHIYPQWAQKHGIAFDIKTRHYSEIISEQIREGKFKYTHEVPGKVTWHDSCHIGRVSGIYDPPREMIKAIPGIQFEEMEYNREAAHCCGSVLTLIKDPPVAHEVGDIRIKEAEEINAGAILALCPCCEFQLRVSADKKGKDMGVHDLAAFACLGLGKKFKDPEPEVMRQWAVFEGMIDLMTPQGFATLMSSMWKELIDAMPLGMGSMMMFIGKLGPVGGALLWMMRPMFPVLFPILLPKMMPKVMPAMLNRVAGKIPMPDYMREQMPELMPRVMDNLMPKMLPDVVPLIVDPMIDYLRGLKEKGK